MSQGQLFKAPPVRGGKKERPLRIIQTYACRVCGQECGFTDDDFKTAFCRAHAPQNFLPAKTLTTI